MDKTLEQAKQREQAEIDRESKLAAYFKQPQRGRRKMTVDPNENLDVLMQQPGPQPTQIKKPKIERSTSGQESVGPKPETKDNSRFIPANQNEAPNFSIGFNAGKQTLFSRMSPTKGTFGNALAATQASSGMIPGAISKSNSAEGQ